MMARKTIYSCPGTTKHPAHQFSYLHYPDIERDPLPRYCGICGWDSMAEDDAQDFAAMPSAPHIAKSIGKAGDMTYRQMEGQAEERIAQAAEMTGLPESEFNDLKITNIKDNLREGDTADIAQPPSEVSKLMDIKPDQFGFQGAQAVRDATMARSYIPGQEPRGAEANIGNAMTDQIGNFHRQNARGMNTRSQIGAYTGT